MGPLREAKRIVCYDLFEKHEEFWAKSLSTMVG